MGILDDAQHRLRDAAGWVKDRAGQIGGRAPGAGQSLGERAADAKHWVASRIGGGAPREAPSGGDEPRSGGGGDFATEWVDVSKDDDLGGPQADGAAGDPEAASGSGGDQRG